MEFLCVADGSLVWSTQIQTWTGTEARNLDLAFIFSEDKRKLTITVNDVLQDDLNTKELIQFLLHKQVIEGDWEIVSMDDTEGRTYIDDTYTTLELRRC